MNKLETWLESDEFYVAMQAYRHSPLTDQQAAVENFEEVKRAILEAAGKRVFVIVSVEYEGTGLPRSYRIQLANSPNGRDAWDGFSSPIENFGPKLLKPGTRFTVEILNDER